MNQIQKPESAKPLSVVEKLATIGERAPLIKAEPEIALNTIFKGLVRTYAYLGHRNIFKGDAVQRQAAKTQIQEIASQILEGYKNNKRFRRITDADFDAVIDKGCASGLSEIKNVSPKAIFDWTDQFLKMYLEHIQRARQEYQEIQDNRGIDQNENIRLQNLEGVKALMSFCIEERTSPYADVKQFQGYWIAQVCKRYSDHLPESFITVFSKRKDLYAAAKEKAEKSRGKKDTDSQVSSKAQKLYCYAIIEEFKMHFEMEGQEEFETTMNTAINEYHDKRK